MTDKNKDEELSPTEEAQRENEKLDFYDEVDQDEVARSAENSSVPDRASRDLWQSTNVGTDGTGPQIEEVAPVFAQARADALSHPLTADDDDDEVANNQSDEAASAQERADAIRQSPGFAAETGPAAGQFHDEADKEAIPEENFNGAPSDDDNDEDDKKSTSRKSAAKKDDAKEDESKTTTTTTDTKTSTSTNTK